MNKDTFQNFRVSVSIFAGILCILLSIGLLSHSNPDGIVFAQSSSNTSEFNEIRNQYVQSWEKLNFLSTFDTYVVGGSSTGYGVYEERSSNIFAPGETLYLYVEPVGFTHNPISDGKGNTMYSVDMSTDITITSSDGIELTSIKDIPISKLVSHQRNTELYLLVSLAQSIPFQKGEYKITYVVKDTPSGKSFDIVKEITIA